MSNYIREQIEGITNYLMDTKDTLERVEHRVLTSMLIDSLLIPYGL